MVERRLQPGDTVGYAPHWLHLMGVARTDSLWHRRGEVRLLFDRVVEVLWDDGSMGHVATSNLALRQEELAQAI